MNLLDDPNSAGLLSLGLRLMSTPGKFGTALGQAGLGAMGDIQQMKAQQQAQKARALQEQMLQMQLQQATAEQQRRQAMQEAAKASFSPGQMLPEGVAGPQLPPQFDVRGFAERMAALGDPSMLMDLQKKAAPIKVGKDDTLLDPTTMKPVFEGKGTPEKPPTSVQEYLYSLENPGFAQWDLRRKKAGATNINTGQKDSSWGAPPKDYVWARDDAGNVVTERDPKTGANRPVALPIGGSADARDDAKTQGRNQALAAQTKQLLGTVDEAIGMVGPMTAGVGGALAGLPMTDARKLAGQLTTIKANLGFDRLQQMRDMSPTGGALGQVAVQELQSLQSTVAMLDQLQSPADLVAALNKIKGHYNRWLQTLEGGQDGGQSGSVRRYNPQTGRIE